jgi:hypothetical protein
MVVDYRDAQRISTFAVEELAVECQGTIFEELLQALEMAVEFALVSLALASPSST